MLKDKPDKGIQRWLISGCLLIFSMVVIGGITRLTGSGLSITEWNVVMGAVPPMNEQEWNAAFEKYQQIPQFQKLNYHFTLSDFKKIFFWEYLHRLIGRLIGLVFIIPFIIFQVQRRMSRQLTRQALLLFVLGGLQGFLGWFMVKSGLTERTSVSHIRLAIHLLAAFITFGFTFWIFLSLRYEKAILPRSSRLPSRSRWLLAVVLLQLVYGAFTAGLHAGRVANTFPTMDGQWIPAGMDMLSPGWKNFFDNLLAVQFIHRCLAYLVMLLTGLFWWQVRQEGIQGPLTGCARFLAAAVLLQVLLGISTLLTGVQITLAVLHQAGAFFVFAAAVFAVHRSRQARLPEGNP